MAKVKEIRDYLEKHGAKFVWTRDSHSVDTLLFGFPETVEKGFAD